MRLTRYSEQDPATVPSLDDPRGWLVETGLDDWRVAEIEDVLLDGSGTPRYYEAEVDGPRHVLIPVGHARLEVGRSTVVLPGLAREAVGDIPTFGRELADVDEAFEKEVADAWDRAYADDTYYENPSYRTPWNRARELPGGGTAPTRIDFFHDLTTADLDHDPRGWVVVGSSGRRIGVVEDLLGDADRLKVQYMTVKVDVHLSPDPERRVLVPAGHAVLEPDHDRVRVPALHVDRVRGCPVWTGILDRPFERQLHKYFARGYDADRRYEHPRYRTDPLTVAMG